MKTIQVLNENGKLAGTMSVDCKQSTKVNKPYFNESFELVIPSGWSEAQLKKWLKSDDGKMAVEANKVAKQAAKHTQEVSPVILTIITMKKEITPTAMKKEIEKKKLIKKMKAEANKALSKVIANTFDNNERNRAMLQIQSLLAEKIKEVEAL